MKLPKALMPLAGSCAILVGGLMLPHTSSAKPEYSKKEKTACKTCHTAAVPKNDDKATHALNDKGKCYGAKKSMADCK